MHANGSGGYVSEQNSIPKGPKTFPIPQPKRAGKIYTLIAYAIILGMVVMYVNTTTAYWQGISNQKQQGIDQLIKELDTTRLELEEVHADLVLKEKQTPELEEIEKEGELEIDEELREAQALGLEGAEKESELEIEGERLSLYELFSQPPGMDELYDEMREGHAEMYGGSYSDINLLRAMLVLHDSGQITLNGRWYRELYGKEPNIVARDKLTTVTKSLEGYQSLEGREKVPRLREVTRLNNLKVLNNFVQDKIEHLAREDYPRFPLETLSIHSGDSEDRVMLLAALLEIEEYETGLLTIFDAENNFYYNALAVKDEAGWIRNKLMFRGYEREGFAWILLDPHPETKFGELPDWTKRYRSASGAIEIPSTKYVFTAIDDKTVQSMILEKYETLKEEDKITIIEQLRDTRTTVNMLGVVNNVGVVLPIRTEIKQGKGRLLLNIHDTLYFADAQSSMVVALKVAKRLTGAKLADKDIIIWLENPYNETITIYGDSAGSSIAIAFIANLQNKKIRDGVLLTGAVNEDGSISGVAGVSIKAEAARDTGAKTLLVPQGQGITKAGIEVIEVSSIEEALLYMLE